MGKTLFQFLINVSVEFLLEFSCNYTSHKILLFRICIVIHNTYVGRRYSDCSIVLMKMSRECFYRNLGLPGYSNQDVFVIYKLKAFFHLVFVLIQISPLFLIYFLTICTLFFCEIFIEKIQPKKSKTSRRNQKLKYITF